MTDTGTPPASNDTVPTIRERHVAVSDEWNTQSCKRCYYVQPSEWPCDARVVLDALDREAANHDVTYRGAQRVSDQRDAARADADRLAEALRPIVAQAWPYDSTHNKFWYVAREALRQH
jgi:hypothetical protein